MNAAELDEAYTLLCTAMTEAGPDATERVLARLSLMLINQVGDLDVVRELIAKAADLSSWPSVEQPGRDSFAGQAS